MQRQLIKKACLLALTLFAASGCTLAAGTADGKEADPAFTVPVVANPISNQDIKDLSIIEDGRRWLVSDKALEQYGVYANTSRPGQYWFHLPDAENGQTPFADGNVSLTLPGVKAKEGRNISIAHVRRPLGISYVLDGDSKTLLPAQTATRSAVVLKQPPRPEGEVLKGKSATNLGMVLLWDPVMDENAEIPAMKTKQPVVSPCAFRISKDGIILRNPDFDTLVADWQAKGYSVWPLVDNDFSPRLTHEVLSKPALRQQLIRELVGYSVLYQFDGYNIDFENVNFSDRDLLTTFVTEFSTAAHAYGLKTSMDVTPLSDSPNWSLVYDRAALGQSLDYVMLMAYDQVGRTSPVPGPTATLPWVDKAIQGTLQFVPAEKVILGMPLYMRIWYDAKNGIDLPKDMASWPAAIKDQPTGSGSVKHQLGVETKAAGEVKLTAVAKTKPAAVKKNKRKLFVRTLTLADSQRLHQKYASHITWDPQLSLYKLDANLPDGRLQVWFEDEKSLKEKVKLIPAYQLGGACFWRKGFEPASFWHGFAKHELT